MYQAVITILSHFNKTYFKVICSKDENGHDCTINLQVTRMD